MQQTNSTAPAPTQRVISIDVFRGMVMFLMLAELLHLHELGRLFPNSRLLGWVQFHTSHVIWEGCSLHDLIQPAFTFLVGVAMPFSIASRIRRGTSTAKLLLHSAYRAVVLILLGVVLRSLNHDQTYWTFEDTLTQIGLGYFFVFLIALGPRSLHYASAALILIGFWIAFAIEPPLPSNFDYQSVGVPADWPHHHDGFAARWNLNSNLSWRFDRWWLNLFPRESAFEYHPEGYATLSFVPTMATMIFGLWAGVWMRDPISHRDRLQKLAVAAAIMIGLGTILAWTDVVPMVKKIWTPSFALYSGGCCMVWLGLLHLICDVRSWRLWGYPFQVIGANSILIYVASWTIAEPLRELLIRHLGVSTFSILGPDFVQQTSGTLTLLLLFGCLLWLYKHKTFIKI